MRIILLNKEGQDIYRDVYFDKNTDPKDIGEIILDMEETLNDKENPFDEITEEEHQELIDEKIYQEIQDNLIHNDLEYEM